MTAKKRQTLRILTTLLIVALCMTVFSGCGGTSASAQDGASQTASGGTRSSFPVVHEPSAPGKQTESADGLTIDYSNLSSGYLSAQYTGKQRIKVQVTGPDKVTYTYDVPDSTDIQVFPLTAGDGTYTVTGFSEVVASKYAKVLTLTLDASCPDSFLPFLTPNQYVWFTSKSEAVAKGQELAEGAPNDLDVITRVYHYCVDSIRYDRDKAKTITSGYLPDVDKTLSDGTGICFDYAALMTAMLRSQRIPTRLEIGYAGEAYHSWISVYTKETGWIDSMIEFDGKEWHLLDPTFAATASDSKKVAEYVGDGENYVWKYSH